MNRVKLHVDRFEGGEAAGGGRLAINPPSSERTDAAGPVQRGLRHDAIRANDPVHGVERDRSPQRGQVIDKRGLYGLRLFKRPLEIHRRKNGSEVAVCLGDLRVPRFHLVIDAGRPANAPDGIRAKRRVRLTVRSAPGIDDGGWSHAMILCLVRRSTMPAGPVLSIGDSSVKAQTRASTRSGDSLSVGSQVVICRSRSRR